MSLLHLLVLYDWSLHRLMFPQMHSVPADFTALKGKECKLGKIYSWTSRFSRFTWEFNKEPLSKHGIFSQGTSKGCSAAVRRMFLSRLYEYTDRSLGFVSFRNNGFAQKKAFKLLKRLVEIHRWYPITTSCCPRWFLVSKPQFTVWFIYF